jgi:hypothetical protein
MTVWSSLFFTGTAFALVAAAILTLVIPRLYPFQLGDAKPPTSNLKWATAPGNVLLATSVTGLPKDSVANVSQVVTLDKRDLTEHVGKLARSKLELVRSGVDVVLGR